MGEEKDDIVWLVEERTFARLLSLGAHFAWVEYTREGIDYEVLIDTNEFTYIKGEDAPGGEHEN